MIFYLDNGDKFLLESAELEIIFIMYSTVTEKIMHSNSRWINNPVFFNEEKHLKAIIELLISDNQGDKNIGKEMLSQALKVKIHGEIVGHKE